MPISITTGGPISSIPTVLEPQIRTFADMINAISDDLDDTNNEYLSQIQEAIFSSIRFCEREAFYFNESREITFKTVSGQEWYGASDDANIASFGGLTAAYCEARAGNVTLLKRENTQALELLGDNNDAQGQPYCYTYFAQKLRLYPIPDRTYRIRLQLSPVRIKNITSANEPNPWFYEAFDLIRSRAKYELYKDIIKDTSQATIAYNDFKEQLEALRAETARRNSTGKIRATEF